MIQELKEFSAILISLIGISTFILCGVLATWLITIGNIKAKIFGERYRWSKGSLTVSVVTHRNLNFIDFKKCEKTGKYILEIEESEEELKRMTEKEENKRELDKLTNEMKNIYKKL